MTIVVASTIIALSTKLMITVKILKTHIGYWLNRLRSLVHHSFEDRLSRYQITIPAWCVLVSVYDGSGTSVNQLAKYIEVDKAAISRIVEKLVKSGLLMHESGSDKRSGRISITDKGKNLIPLLLKKAEENEKQFFKLLNDEEQELLRSIIGKIISNNSSIGLEGWLDNNNKESNNE